MQLIEVAGEYYLTMLEVLYFFVAASEVVI
jgi:hypothetical protein